MVSSASVVFVAGEALAPLTEGAAAVAGHHPAGPGGQQHARRRGAGGTRPGDDDADILEPFVDDAERVQEPGEDDDRGPVLVVVEDRDVELPTQARLDFEAARRGDVLEVDASEPGRQRP